MTLPATNDPPVQHGPATPSDWSLSSFDPWALWRRKHYLLLSVFTSLVIGVAWYFVTPPKYEAQSRVLIKKAGLHLDRPETVLEERQFLATQAEIIASPLIVREALENTTVTLPPESTMDPVEFVLISLTATPKLQTDVMTIRYRSRDMEEPLRVIRAVTESYKNHVQEIEHSTSTDTLELLARREKELRAELQTMQEEYRQTRSHSPLLGQDIQTYSLQLQRFRHLGERLAVARTHRVDLEKKLQTLGRPDDIVHNAHEELHFVSTPHFAETAGLPEKKQVDDTNSMLFIALSDDAFRGTAAEELFRQEAASRLTDITNLQRALWESESTAEDLAKSFGPDHPERRAVEGQIELCERRLVEWRQNWDVFLRERIDAVTATVTRQLAIAKSTEEQLTELYDTEQINVRALENDRLQEEVTLGNIERLKQVHQATLTRLANFRLVDNAVSEGRASVTVRVLEEPIREMVWPKKIPLLGICGFIGLMCGCVLVVVLEQRSTLADNSAHPAGSHDN